MKLVIGAFKGELPILDPTLLSDQNAQVARNLYLRRGTLKAERGYDSRSVTTVINPKTLWRYPNGNGGAGFWFTWGTNVDVVKSPLANDEWDRIYWTGEGGYPRVAGIDKATTGSAPYPGGSWRLGVPAPTSAPTVAAPGGRVGTASFPDTAVETAYVVTFVTRYGEEGPPSNPSSIITRWDMVTGAPAGGNVTVGLPGIPSGNYDFTSKRIYRVESGAVYQFAGEVSTTTSSFTDNVLSEGLGVGLPSEEWYAPNPLMKGLTVIPGGIGVGFFDNTLCLSEPYRLHAWPPGYQLAFQDDIVAVVSTGSGLIVTTKGQPVLVTGASPAAMSPRELDSHQPCVSARSMVDMGEYAMYASPDGLVAAGGTETEVVTRNVMSKVQWHDLNPSTIHAYRNDGRYIGFYSGGCFAFTPSEGFEFYDLDADAGYYDIADDIMYVVEGNQISAWAGGSPMTYTWRSKIFEVIPGGEGFNCFRLVARAYPVTMRLYGDGALFHEQSVTSGAIQRLPPGGYLQREWEIEIEGSNEVVSVQVASSPEEIV